LDATALTEGDSQSAVHVSESEHRKVEKDCSSSDRRQVIDLSPKKILCMHGQLGIRDLLWRRSRVDVEELISKSTAITFENVPKIVCSEWIDLGTDLCSVCVQSAENRMQGYREVTASVINRSAQSLVGGDWYVFPAYWLQRIRNRLVGTSQVSVELRFNSILCEHGFIRGKYFIASKEECDVLLSDEFRREVCGLGKWIGEQVPTWSTSRCDECDSSTQIRRNVNIRIFDNEVTIGSRVDDDNGNLVWLKPGRSRLVGTTDQIDLSADLEAVKEALNDIGVFHSLDDDGIDSSAIEIWINHPSLRGALVELGSGLIHDVVDTIYVRSSSERARPVTEVREAKRFTTRANDRDAGLQGSILREPIDLS
jgi:hypothetical protein